mmetsp:Transcript_72964/g.152326  ORF Transcript_72964/g.152326 Transcript_72964/m.152326 type:complete len:516 (-) Transcript_72964:57-1604(-)
MADDLDAPTLPFGGEDAGPAGDDPLLDMLGAAAPAEAARSSMRAPEAPMPDKELGCLVEDIPKGTKRTLTLDLDDVLAESGPGATGDSAAAASAHAAGTSSSASSSTAAAPAAAAVAAAAALPTEAAAAAALEATKAPAALLSTNAETAADIPLGEATVSVGRGETCNIVLKDERVSGEQFVITSKREGSGKMVFYLEDKSKNGTHVSKRLVKHSTILLQEHDLVEVLPASKVGPTASISFLFRSTEGAAGEPAAKKRRVGEAPSAESALEGATCAICQEVMHRATSVQPCMHCFCSSCLGHWLKKPGDGGKTCPMCRTVATGVARNPTLDGVLESLLKAYPESKRSEEALKELDSSDALMAAGYDLDKLRGTAARRAVGLPMAPMPGLHIAGLVHAMRGPIAAALAAAGDAGFEHSDSEGEHSGSEGSDDHREARQCVHCGHVSFQSLATLVETTAGNMMECDRLMKATFHNNEFEKGILEEWLRAHAGLRDSLIALLTTPNPPGFIAVVCVYV